jgi:hypothetical protein
VGAMSCSSAAYLQFSPSFHLRSALAYMAARNGRWHTPIVSSTSACRVAEAEKARLPLRAAR